MGVEGGQWGRKDGQGGGMRARGMNEGHGVERRVMGVEGGKWLRKGGHGGGKRAMGVECWPGGEEIGPWERKEGHGGRMSPPF